MSELSAPERGLKPATTYSDQSNSLSIQPRIQQLIDQILQRLIHAVRQSLDLGAATGVIGNLLYVTRLDARIPNLLGIKHDVRAGSAPAEAHVRFDLDFTRGTEFFLQLLQKHSRAARFAVLVLTNEHVLACHG